MLKFEKRINYLLHLKYKTDEQIFDANIIDNIIFNDRTHLVTQFKDYLIAFEDFDFLKRYYTKEELKIKLKKIVNYYKKHILLFPNYSVFPESKIIYKNINFKQKILDNIDYNNKKRSKLSDNENKTNMMKNLNSKESTDNLVFNSNVYDSIFKEADNCLSIFSFDKESTYIDNKEEEGINKLINCFNKIDNNIKNNKKEISRNKNKIIYKSLNIENEIEDIDNYLINNDNNGNKNNNNDKIYKRKKTPINIISSRHKNICSSHTLNIKNQDLIDKEEINNFNIRKSYNSNFENGGISLLSNKKKGIYKKIKLNLTGHSRKENNRSTSLSRNKQLFNKSINDPKSNKNSIISKNEINSENGTVYNQINGMPLTINLVEDEPRKLPRIKVNKKRKNEKKKNSKINTLILDHKMFSFFHQIPKTTNYLENKKLYNNLNNSSKVNSNNENLKDSINNNKSYNNNNTNILKGTKMNLVKNKIKKELALNYIINNYNSKLIEYNTSILFNNNNINIINNNGNDSNRLNTNNNKYGNDPFNKSSNLYKSVSISKNGIIGGNTLLNKSDNLLGNISLNKSNNINSNIDLSKSTNMNGNTPFNKKNNNLIKKLKLLNENTSLNKSNNILENTPFNNNNNYSDFINNTPYEKKILITEKRKNVNRKNIRQMFNEEANYLTSFQDKKRRSVISKEILKTKEKSNINISNNDTYKSETFEPQFTIPLNNKLITRLKFRTRNDTIQPAFKTTISYTCKNNDIDKNFIKKEFLNKEKTKNKNNNMNNEKKYTFIIKKKSENNNKDIKNIGNSYINRNEDYLKKKNNTVFVDNVHNHVPKNYIKIMHKGNKDLEKDLKKKKINEIKEKINLIRKSLLKKENKNNKNKVNDNSNKRIFLENEKDK